MWKGPGPGRPSTIKPGDRFGRLVVKQKSERKVKHTVLWDCECDCGRKHTTRAQTLNSGECRSCGCLNQNISSEHRFMHNRILKSLFGSDGRYELYARGGICFIREV